MPISDNRSHGKQTSSFPEVLIQWFIQMLQLIWSFVTGGVERITGGNHDRSYQALLEEPRAAGPEPRLLRKLRSGLNRIRLAQRLAALEEQYGSVKETVRASKRMVKSIPRSQRWIFGEYKSVLEAMEKRIGSLYERGSRIAESLKRYDPETLSREIRELEERLAGGNHPSPEEAERTIEARRQLLAGIEATAAALERVESRFRYITAILELNHTRIASIATHVNGTSIPSGDADELEFRLTELTEQLALLDELNSSNF